jgi:hypothetical protein
MPYEKQTFIDHETKLTAAHLQHIEDGIEKAFGAIANASGYYRATDYGISTEAEDNTIALQALIDDVSAKGGGIIFFPIGVYKFKPGTLTDKYPYQKTAIMMASNVSIIGENIEKTVLKQTVATPYSMFRKMGEPDTPITGCTFANFTVDAYDTGDVNAVHGKAFFFQYVKDCVFRDLILRGTVATAMGIDFLDRVVIDNVSCIDCGRTFTGPETGTSGIGIGTAGWENENFIVTNCICDRCGQYGIFIENQGLFGDGNVDYAKGCIISNCIVRNGLNKGIGVRGGQNVTVIGCETYENTSHGIYVDNNCKDVKVLSCGSVANGGCGICIEPNVQSNRIVVRDCHFTDNEMAGISVNTSSMSLCLTNNYTASNRVGLKVLPVTLIDCVIKWNIFFDGDDITAVFSGNTKYNDFSDVEVPDIKTTTITADMYTEGYKLMPNGSLSAEALAYTTLSYIDVSELSNTFTFEFGDTKGMALRIAQYDKNKVSLSDNFEQTWIGDSTIKSVNATKLSGCKYIRIFASGNPTVGELENVSTPDTPEGIKTTTITADMYTEGYKLMPNGSLSAEALAYTTLSYIDVSELSNTFTFEFGDTKGMALRIAQYDENKVSLSSNFTQTNISNSANQSITITKLSGCKYIRIFSSSNPTVGELENISTPDTPEGIKTTTITADMYTEGKKLMPNGSLSDEALAYTTLSYIDVSELSNTFTFEFGDTKGTALRIAQYDENQVSLSDNFEQTWINDSTIKSVNVTKLSGCKYIRIFSSSNPTVGELENISAPDANAISIPFNSMTAGKKLMPDGSLADGEVGSNNTTEAYIDVSTLADTFILRYPANADGTIRIAQYDSSKTSLSTSFGMNSYTETTAEYQIWHATKLDGCKYIRICLFGGFANMNGELLSV